MDNSTKWQSRYSIAKNNQSKLFKRFASWYDLMYAAINTKDYAPWRSKVYIPILASKAWAILAKLQALSPGFEVGVYNDSENSEEAQQQAKKAQWKLEYDWNNPDFDEPMTDKLFAPLVDALVTGTGLAKVPWDIEEKTSYKRPIIDEEKGYVDLTKQEATKSSIGHNDLIPVNIFNVFMAPGASNLYGAEWVIIKEFKTLDALKSSGIYNEAALNKLSESRADSDEFAQQKKSRNRLTQDQDPIASDETLDYIEIFECYEPGYMCTFAASGSKKGEASWVEIRKQENVYWHGKYPLVPFYVRRRPYDFWGQGLFEDTERMQRAVIDIFNHFIDSYNLSVNSMISRQQGEDLRYVIRPGGEITYRNNKPELFKHADPNPAVFNQVYQVIGGALEEATISQYATGTPDSQTDQTQGTAAGIKSLQNAAGDKIGFFKANYRTSLRQIGSMWLSNNQQFLAVPVTVDGQVNNRPAPVTVTPADMQGNMVLRINDASMEPVGHDQQLQTFLQYQQFLMGIQQASIAQSSVSGGVTKPLLINFSELAREGSEKMGQNNFDSLIMPETDIPPPQPEGQPQDQPKLPSESMSYKDVPEDIKRQMEAQAGFQPSSMISPTGTDQLTKHLNTLTPEPQGAPNGRQEPQSRN